MRRVLFVVRGKLGDSLRGYAVVRQYVDQFPEDDVTLLMRRNYVGLLAGERGLRIVPFGSRLEMVLRLLLLRLGKPFDVLAVLWGFGSPIRTIARMVRARRRIYVDGRFPDLYPEWAPAFPTAPFLETLADVVRIFEPRFVPPAALSIPSLRPRADAQAVAVVPLSDELRRNMNAATLDVLLREVRRRHPRAPIHVLLNPSDRGAAELLSQPLPDHVQHVQFPRLEDLVEEYRGLAAWYGTDTGLYHLAAAMGIPCTLFFGPTQPFKTLMPQQPNVEGVRLTVLGQAHCDVTTCTDPVCLRNAVAAFAGEKPELPGNATPAACPLRAHADLASVSDPSGRKVPG